MFGVSYFASNADEYFMVLNNQNFSLGIIDDNPTFVQVIGMCPTLAVTSSAINGIGMGLSREI